MWKYVDDVSLSEGIIRNSDSTTQSNLDTISSWASLNWMKLNAKKCKELRVCYLRETPQLAPLQIDGRELELVTSHKVLGLMIQSNLKWNDHISAMYGATIGEHDERLEAVLKRLEEANVTLNPEKCLFAQETVSFLGQLVGKLGIQADPAKVEAVRQMQKPNNTPIENMASLPWDRDNSVVTVAEAPLLTL